MRFEDILTYLCNPTITNPLELVNILSTNQVLYESEQILLTEYSRICQDTGTAPSIDVLKFKCPQFVPTQVEPLNDLIGVIRAFVKTRKNNQTGRKVQELGVRIATEGITPEIADQLTNVVKSDVVEIKYRNIQNRILDVYESKVDDSGIKTGISSIDKKIGGLQPSQVTTIGGFTGAGKSILSVSIAYNAAQQGYNVAYISLELSAEHLMYNLYSRHSYTANLSKKIEHRDLKHKKLDEEQLKCFKEEVIPTYNELEGKVYILDEQDIESYTFFSFDNKLLEVEKLAINETGHGIDLFIVDHVQMLKFATNDKMSEGSMINKWVDYFRQNAMDWLKTKRQVHCILDAQINRTGWQRACRNNGHYSLTALAEASELERASAQVLTIFSDPSLIASKECKISLLKSRDGSVDDEPNVVYADYPYCTIADVGATSNETFADMSIDDVFASQDMDFSIDAGGIETDLNLDIGNFDIPL